MAETVRSLLGRAIVRLARSTETPRLDAQLLLAHTLGHDKAWLVSQDQTPVPAAGAQKFWELIEKRKAGMPVAYLTGTWGFYGREFEVTPDVLVPRPETEHLVGEALTYLGERAQTAAAEQRFNVLDVGTGSGAVACSVAAEFARSTVQGTDISAKAIALAQKNARRLRVQARCTFYLGDLAAPVAGSRYDCVIANLPYVPSADLPRRPDPVSFEPALALDGGADGLALYRRLMAQLPALLQPGALLLLEAAPQTIDGLCELTAEYFPRGVAARTAIEIGRDYADLPRYVKVRFSPQSRGART